MALAQATVNPETEDDLGIVQLDRAEVILAMQHDLRILASLYLQDELTLEIPEFHLDIWDEFLRMIETAQTMHLEGITYKLRKLFAVPRDHSKSTLAKLAVILFLKYSPLSFVLYVSKTNSKAKNAIRDIMLWLQSPQEKFIHGPFQVLKSSETESLWIADMSIRKSLTQPPTVKRIIFQALGADQQVRGTLILNKRPQIVIIDDIEDLDNTTPELQPKLDEWFLGSLMKSYDSNKNLVVFIGNMIRETTLLARLSKDKAWNPTVFGSLVREEDGAIRPLWEGKHTAEELLAEYESYRALGAGHVWEAEMMNLTKDAIIRGDLAGLKRIPLPLPEDLRCGAITIDPAFGENAWNDDSAIAVHARVANIGIPFVVETSHGNFREDDLFDEAWNLSQRWGVKTWFIESDAAQKLLIPYFTLLMQTRYIPLNSIVMIPIMSGKKKKSSRILAFRSSVSVGSYGITETEDTLITKLAEYTPESTAHDDLCDAAAYGLLIWATYGDVIESNGNIHTMLEVRGESDDSDDDPSDEAPWQEILGSSTF